MVWRPEDDRNPESTWKPLTPQQQEELRRNHIEPRLEIVPSSTPTKPYNEIGRMPLPTPTPQRKPTNTIVYH